MVILGGGELELHLSTVIVILSSAIAFIAGDAFGFLLSGQSRHIKASTQIGLKVIRTTPRMNMISIVIMFIIIIYTLYAVRSATTLNLNGTLLGSFREQGSNKGLLASLMNGFATSLSYFYTIPLIRGLIFKEKVNKGCFIVVLLYIPVFLLSGARIQMLFYTCYVIYLIYSFSRIKNGSGRSVFNRTVKISLSLFISLLIAFYFAGYLTGKSNSFRINEIILVYAGGPIYGLDYYLDNFINTPTDGLLTFSSWHFLLENLGIDSGTINFGYAIGTAESSYYPIIPEHGLWGNVYTVLMPWIHDYGFIGMLVASFIVSSILSYFAAKVTASKHNYELKLSIISVMLIPLMMSSIADFFSEDLSYKRLLVILFIYIFYRISTNNSLNDKIYYRTETI